MDISKSLGRAFDIIESDHHTNNPAIIIETDN